MPVPAPPDPPRRPAGHREKKERIVANTRQFLAGKRANNVLLTGARGTGKSSLVKALLNEFAGAGLRLIEVDKDDLIDLPDIVEPAGPPGALHPVLRRPLLRDGEPAYKALKSVLDGSLAAVPDNVLIYATSNRRHLMPEYFSENAATKQTWTARCIRPRRSRRRSPSRSASGCGSPSTPSARTNTWRWSITGWASLACQPARSRRPRRRAAMGAAARLPQRSCGLAVRPRLRRALLSMSQAPRKIVHVAAAVITRPDGSFLLGQRAPDTFYPGYWEFPGGKVEPARRPATR